MKLYLDTSIFGAFFDTEDQKRLKATEVLCKKIKREKYKGFISPVVFEEIARAPDNIKIALESKIKEVNPSLLNEIEESLILAEEYIKLGLAPEKYRNDARHVAVATVYGLDAVVSWNYRHLVNVARKRIIHSVNLRFGYSLIEIISPWEVVEID